jgi:hypothetical protein
MEISGSVSGMKGQAQSWVGPVVDGVVISVKPDSVNCHRPRFGGYVKFRAMMLMRTVIVTIMMLIALPNPSFTQSSSALPEAAKDPFVGTWRANANKSSPKLDKNKALYVRTISRDGDDVVFSSRTKKTEKHYRIRCDGLFHRVSCGGDDSCTKSCIYKTANRIEGESTTDNGKQHWTWTEEVSSDGQEMRIYGYTAVDRKTLHSTEVLDRVK